MAQSNPARSRDAPSRDQDRAAVAKSKAVQDIAVHPLTVFPTVVGVLGGVAMVAIAANPITLAVTLGGFFLGAASFTFQLFTTGEDRTEKNMKELLAADQANEDREAEGLKGECEKLGFAEGARVASGFATSYGNLVGYLNGNADGIGMDRYRTLARGANREAVRRIKQAIDVFKALQTVNIQQIVREQQRWKSELEGIPATSATALSLGRKIEAHEETIRVYRERTEALNAELAKLNELESATQTLYLKLVSRATDLDGDTAAADLLANAIEADERLLGQADREAAEKEAKRAKYRKREEQTSEGEAVSPAEAAAIREREARARGNRQADRDAHRE